MAELNISEDVAEAIEYPFSELAEQSGIGAIIDLEKEILKVDDPAG